MPPPELTVVTDGLTKRFGDLVAVDRIDLQVEPGTVFSLLGPNGAGKTTVVRMLATLSEPTSGTAIVCGHDVVREADAVRQAISMTGQFAALEDNLTARENLLLMARLRGYGKAAVSGGASTSPPAWSSSLSSWSSTSRPPGLTPAAARWCGRPCATWSTTASRCCSPRSTSKRLTRWPTTSS
jgi:ABC-type branched-subunit amino acid transport system ATPase component